MAKTKPQDRTGKSKKQNKNNPVSTPKRSKTSPENLLIQATALLHTGQPEDALPLARRALSLLQPTAEPTVASLRALDLLGEINVELGDVEAARDFFLRAVSLDPEGQVSEDQGGGSEKFLWLAQLCEEGGAQSVGWFEKGATVLRRQIGELEGKKGTDAHISLEEKKKKLANALCGVVEVYMTDLSWEEDAEARCEALVTEALLVAPETPEPLQTLASVRISQLKLEDARAALKRSIELWKDLAPEDPAVPDFPSRISLSRLLMEAELEEDAIEVLERLVAEDDSSIEAWYLGGWCLNLLSKKQTDQKTVTALLKASRDWLMNSLKLYQMVDYEDVRLKDHANELVEEMNKTLGPRKEDDDEEEWEDEGDEEDEGSGEDAEMEGT